MVTKANTADYPVGKQALQQENTLLAALFDVTDKYMRSLPTGSLGRQIAKDWRGSFKELQDLNQALIDASPTNYATMLDEEIDSSTDFLRFVRRSMMGDSWKSYFKSELKIAKALKEG
ncbi:MAG: hypothetical protein JNK47_15565 [Mesorhizobium sp.]|nr:hypothetical protein [Mesorhizobium sp.]MBL8578642.1 hypothetical protein [Mesorhizobium sp.]